MIDLPVRVIRGDFRALYGVAVAVSLLGALPGAAIQFISGSAQQAATPLSPLSTTLPVFALFGLSYLLAIIAQLTIYEAVRRSIDGERVLLGACLAKGFNPLSVVIVLVGYAAAFMAFFCFCVPGVVLGLGLALVIAVLVDGDARGFGALARSWELVFFRWSEWSPRPMWLRAAGLMLVFYLIYTALSSLTTMPAAILAAFVTVREAASGSAVSSEELMQRLTWMQVIVTFLGALVAAIAYLYAASSFTLLFRQAREELEAPMIEAALEERLASARAESP
jgi:hypothetical protein